ncbi:hypothetical protein D9619_001002 [Psilocybe cf. subviscida]|uniref:FAD-binding FR-type domain-containing protein n=1 Tax=Psilocybe cf. subviscida TaxID=2480587 RepID=A0A8H5BE30_9AGAR|nr:hypothetical protein D9619_001002 [Psilocybe cf. subviscida]
MWRRLPSPRLPSTTRAWASTKSKARARAKKASSESLFEDGDALSPLRPPPRPNALRAPIPQQRRFDRDRLINIAIAFAGGFSIYFFLEDPAVLPPRPEQPPIPATQYVPTKLVSSEESGPDTKLMKIAAPLNLYPRQDEHGTFDPVWSVFVKDDDIQVERAYTPLNGVDGDGNMLFWIKKYPNGEVGRWLHSKAPGDTIEVRGPLKTWPWKEDTWDEVVMISGGTGITPFVQLFNKVIKKSKPDSTTRFTLLHSSRIPAELPPSVILDPMISFAAEHPKDFNLHLFVDEDDGSQPSAQVSKKLIGRISESSLKQCIDAEDQPPPSTSWRNSFSKKQAPQAPDGPKRRILFLVCGPEAMIGAIAGPFGRNLSQGPVGGLLGKMGYTSSEVYKL